MHTRHLHEETHILPIHNHLKLHASQLRQQAQHPDHNLYPLTRQDSPQRYMKQTIFDNNNNYTHNIDTDSYNTTHEIIKQNMKDIHTHIVTQNTASLSHNKVLNDIAPYIHPSEQTLTHSLRRTLAQLRTDKSPLLLSYLHKISPTTYPSPRCPLCNHHSHDTQHLFQCPNVLTPLSPRDLWSNPVGVGGLVARWRELLRAAPVAT